MPSSTASSSRVSAVCHNPASMYFSGSTIDTLVALTGGTLVSAPSPPES